MSKIRLYGATSGYTELVPPTTAANNSINLPNTVGEAVVKNTDGNINITSINTGPLAGFRNAIINGNFDVWQRGDTFNAVSSSSYTADRWLITYDGGGTRNITRDPFTLGQTDVPGEPQYALKWDQTVAPTGANFNNINQKIEGVRTFAGQQVTLSFYAKASASISLDGLRLGQDFGTGGSPSAGVTVVVGTNIAVGTSWQKYTYTVTLPSISGKTLGTDGNDNLNLAIRMPLTGTFTCYVAQVQLETGTVATPFERRPIGQELLLCQRYFRGPIINQAFGTGSSANRYAAAAGTYYMGHFTFGQPMRTVPTVTIDTSSIAYLNCSSIGTGTVREDGTFFLVTVTGAGAYHTNTWTASFDAEF